MSGAEIEQGVISAMFDAFEAHETLATEHMLRAIAATRPLSHTMREDIEAQRSWARGRAAGASLGADAQRRAHEADGVAASWTDEDRARIGLPPRPAS
jgi:hypothetical protein